MRVRLTLHAKHMLIERDLNPSWIERVIANPLWTEPEPARPFIVRAFGQIAEAGDRILRVAYTDRAGERIVHSLHFDCKASRRYRSTGR
jgi:hypothetical protein